MRIKVGADMALSEALNMKIRDKAIVQKQDRSGFFLLTLQDNETHEVLARVSGKMDKKHITLCPGDLVDVELSPYDLTRGRIIWRH